MSRRRMMMQVQEGKEVKEEKIVDITLEEEGAELSALLTEEMYGKIMAAKEIFCMATIEGSAETQTATGTVTLGIYRTDQGWYPSSFAPIKTYAIPQSNAYKTSFRSILFRGSAEEKYLMGLCSGLKDRYNSARVVCESEVPAAWMQNDKIRMVSSGIPMGVGTNLKIYLRS